MEDWLKIVIPLIGLIGAITAWCLNEYSKLKWEKYIRKEDRYRGFLKSIHGFYVASQDKEERFLSGICG